MSGRGDTGLAASLRFCSKADTLRFLSSSRAPVLVACNEFESALWIQCMQALPSGCELTLSSWLAAAAAALRVTGPTDSFPPACNREQAGSLSSSNLSYRVLARSWIVEAVLADQNTAARCTRSTPYRSFTLVRCPLDRSIFLSGGPSCIVGADNIPDVSQSPVPSEAVSTIFGRLNVVSRPLGA